MNALVVCPGCGFRGRVPDGITALKSIVCPQCQTAVPVDQLRRGAVPVEDPSFPIWVDNVPGDRTPLPPVERPLAPPPVPQIVAQAEPQAAPQSAPPPIPQTARLPVPAPEPAPYTGEFMKEEAGRFAQYVAVRLGELQKKRLQLAEAENRFESMTMEQKQELALTRAAFAADAARVKETETALQAKVAVLVVREAELAAREAEVAARESRVARAESRATETDRRTADLRAAIDQLEARRAALAEERVALDRRAEQLDRAELAHHRRAAELDELDERLRLEQEEFEREREQEIRGRVG